MSKSPELPQDLVEYSLDEYVKFTQRIIPLLRVSCLHAKQLVRTPPPGGVRCPESEVQLYPAFVRNAMHQLIEANNRNNSQARDRLNRRHIRNGAVCLVVRDTEFRLLKNSKRHPTRPSGRYQEALINQSAYWDMIYGQPPLIRLDRAILGGLLYYQTRDMELLDAYVVIPNGFLPGRGIQHAGSRQLVLTEDLDKLATFDGGSVLDVLADPTSLVIAPDAVPDLGTGDPHEWPVDDEASELRGEDEASIFESFEETRFDSEDKEDND